MPAYDNTNVAKTTLPTKPKVSHVNMQLDSFLANSTVEDLRAIVRNLLATGPSGTTPALTRIARSRISTTAFKRVGKPCDYWVFDEEEDQIVGSPVLWETMAAARTLMGVGLGFESLPILTTVIQTILTQQWEEESLQEEAMFTIDTDIAQAIQSCKEQLVSADDLVKDRDTAKQNLENLRIMIQEVKKHVEGWGGEFPLERAELSVDSFKLKL